MNCMGVLTRALRNVSRRKVRALLVVVALGFSMAIMISIPSSVMANQAAIETLNKNYNDAITGMENEINKTMTLIECSLSPTFGGGFGQGPGQEFRPGFTSGEEQYINETAINDIISVDGVKDVLAFLEKTEGTTESRETPRGTFTVLSPDYTIVGVPLNSSLLDNYQILPTDIIEGRTLQEGDSGVVLLSSNNTQFFGVDVGDEVSILGKTFTVVGVYEPMSSLGSLNLYMNISDAQTITGLEGKVSRLDVYAEDQSHVDGIVSEISSLYPEFYVSTYEERLSQLQRMQETYATMLESAESNLSQTQSIAFQEIVVTVAATSLIVLFTMLYTVRERTKEIGILKAIGFSNWNVMSQFMLEGIFLSLMAGAVGVFIGYVGAPLISSLLLPISPFSIRQGGQFMTPGAFLSQSLTSAPDLQTMLLMFGAAVLLGALGSLYPAWRASRTSPMEALRYE
jgi:putative ABC transport system permease protein